MKITEGARVKQRERNYCSGQGERRWWRVAVVKVVISGIRVLKVELTVFADGLDVG